MMSKFKVGDEVKIIDTICKWKTNCHSLPNRTCVGMKGVVTEIKSIKIGLRLDDHSKCSQYNKICLIKIGETMNKYEEKASIQKEINNLQERLNKL